MNNTTIQSTAWKRRAGQAGISSILLLALCLTVVSSSPGQGLIIGDATVGKIMRTDANSTGSLLALENGPGSVYGLAVEDDIPTYVFWTDFAGPYIRCLNVRDSIVTTIASQASAGLMTPRGIAVDPAIRRVYWTDNGTGKLQKCWYDGSHVTTLMTTLKSPGAIALDRMHQKIYVADNDASVKAILRCDTAGSSQQTVVTGLWQVKGIALADNYIYWIDAGAQMLRRANITGTLPATPEDVKPLTGSPRGLAIDEGAGMIYWTTIGTNSIYKMSLTTLVPQLVNSGGLSAPSSIALSWSAFLPITLSQFTASLTGTGTVDLRWRTESEQNNYGFAIERLNGASWDSIGFRPGAGTSTAQHDYQFTDQTAGGVKHFYRLKQSDLNGSVHYSEAIQAGSSSISGLSENGQDAVPTSFELGQNYPNPFNPSTIIRISVPELSTVTIRIYDLTGSEVATWLNSEMPAGYYTMNFNGSGLASGMYFYRMTAVKANDGTQARIATSVRRLVLLK